MKETANRDNRRVLISGASVAGPALALWLERYGFEVTIVEKASEIRPGGQAVDFKGTTHHTVLERMGILDELRAAEVPAGDETIVDASGRGVGTIPAAFSGGELNVPRGDIARALYERTAASCEYVFGDSITTLNDTGSEVEVSFANAPDRTFDLVVGADGIHSNVRRLAFGPEADFVSHLGYYYALAEVEVDGEDQMYTEPGRTVALGGGKAPAFFVFASDPLAYDRDDVDAQKRLLAEAYRGAAWKTPEILAQMPDADPFYFDSISRVTADSYRSGRVVLLGDSAYGNALGGFGTGLAIVGSYVLAGELAAAGGDHRRAYERYESKFRDYAKVSQKVNAGKILAPSSSRRIYLRNKLFSVAALFAPLMKLSDRFATDIELEDYRGLAV